MTDRLMEPRVGWKRMPTSAAASMVMSMTRDGDLGWTKDDHHSGSVVLKVHPPKRQGPTGPNPHRRMPKPKAKTEPPKPPPGHPKT